MNAQTLLQNLTQAIDAVRDTAAAAAEAFKVSYSASVSDKASAKSALIQAETRAAHARYEYQATLSEARAHLSIQN
jgi:hypothetical protein